MRKEYWRKAAQCAKCVYHAPAGTRPDSMDPEAVWKEACHCCGYSFWPELEEAEMCYDFSTGPGFEKVDKAEKEFWAKGHLCSQCAFYDMNGYSAYIPLDRGGEASKRAEWNLERRCRGYVNVKEKDCGSFCSSFLSLDQWAEVQSCPPCSEEKGHKWNEFIAKNIQKGIK